MNGHSIQHRDRLVRLLTALLSALCLVFTGGIALAYNNQDMPCGTWPNGNPVGVQWKWGGDINTSGNWAYAFASVAEPRWDDTYSKLDLGYNSSASGEFDVAYIAVDGVGGQYYAWCHWWDTDQLADFLAEGNTYEFPDNSWDSVMGNAAGHEIGHILGFGHSWYPAVMMQGWEGNWPTNDDTSGLNSLYP